MKPRNLFQEHWDEHKDWCCALGLTSNGLRSIDHEQCNCKGVAVMLHAPWPPAWTKREVKV